MGAGLILGTLGCTSKPNQNTTVIGNGNSTITGNNNVIQPVSEDRQLGWKNRIEGEIHDLKRQNQGLENRIGTLESEKADLKRQAEKQATVFQERLAQAESKNRNAEELLARERSERQKERSERQKAEDLLAREKSERQKTEERLAREESKRLQAEAQLASVPKTPPTRTDSSETTYQPSRRYYSGVTANGGEAIPRR